MRGKSDRRMLTIIHLLNLDVCSASCFTASISFLHAAARPYFLTTIPCAACDRVSICSKVHIFKYPRYDGERMLSF